MTGQGVFAKLKFESGVHRVQRVPVTESGGRIHTSAATVAVLPEPEEVDVQIDEQGSAHRHLPRLGRGRAARQHHRLRGAHHPLADRHRRDPAGREAQHKNKAKAMQVLRARLYEDERERVASAEAEARKAMVGSGDRSERIRTYNFPQGRVTDHRINLTLHRLPEMLEGQLDELVVALDRRGPGRAAGESGWDKALREAARRLGGDERYPAARCRAADGPRAGRSPRGRCCWVGRAPSCRKNSRRCSSAGLRASRSPISPGTRDFWTITLNVAPGVLIPRPDSETLIDAAVAHFGTAGPGRCSISVRARARCCSPRSINGRKRRGLASMLPKTALAIARTNAERLGLQDRASFQLGDWARGAVGAL